jgi:predicted membrane protein
MGILKWIRDILENNGDSFREKMIIIIGFTYFIASLFLGPLVIVPLVFFFFLYFIGDILFKKFEDKKKKKMKDLN